MKILITGSSGFIGMHTSNKLISMGHKIIGIDNMNNYYDVLLKKARLNFLKKKFNSFEFQNIDILDHNKLKLLFKKEKFDIVINLAAQAGVRYSLSNPQSYVNNNIQGFFNILESCRYNGVKHLVYASSSSVYGLNSKLPFSEEHNTDQQASFYGFTKKTNELMAQSYSYLYSLPCTGLRFFTVYGPWGRPDMALFLFTKLILNNKPIDVYNYGNMKRDFTYIDDIVEGICLTTFKIPSKKNMSNDSLDKNINLVPHKIFNIGNNKKISLINYIEEIETVLGKKAIKRLLPMQKGDVLETHANVDKLFEWVNYNPKTSVAEGIRNFVYWYKDFYRV